MLQVSACKSPFDSKVTTHTVPEGLTVQQIIDTIQPDPALRKYGVVFIGDWQIKKQYWHLVKPRAGSIISIKILPRGGGAGRIIAMIAIVVVAVAVSAVTYGALSPLMSTLAAGTIAGLAGAAVSIGGSLLVNTLLPAPVPAVSKDYGNTSDAYAITGSRNSANYLGKLPFVGGRMRTVPPYGALPYREVIGGQIYWRALFALGHGPISIEDLRIGTTDFTEYQGVEIEARRGYWEFFNKGTWDPSSGVFPVGVEFGDQFTATTNGTVGGQSYSIGESITYNRMYPYTDVSAWDRDQEKQFKLFGTDVYEDALSSDVKYAAPIVRTTQVNCDVATIELVFSRGLTHLQNIPAGKPSTLGVAIRIEQSPRGAGAWTIIAEVPIYGSQTSPLFWGYRWNTKDFGIQAENKQYDIRITRMSVDYDESRFFGNFTWYSLKSEKYATPLPKKGVAYLAMRVKASGQLSGTLDEVNTVLYSQCRDYDADSDTWIWRKTNSPAALFRHMLQHPARQVPATDDQIDLERLQYWDSLTRPTNRVFNGVFDSKGSLWDALVDVSRVGRATPTLRDLIYSVVIDEPKTSPVRMFTPENSYGYSGEITHDPIPHAYRIGFKDESNDWASDELLVYDDGYDATNAKRIDRVDWIGITNSSQLWKEGRFHLAQLRLRREIHKSSCDFEHLICERGDLVAIQYDSIAVGNGAMRIRGRSSDGTNVTSVTLDSGVTTYSGGEYAIRARRVVDGAQRTDIYKISSPVLQKVGDSHSNYANNAAVTVDIDGGSSVGDRVLGFCFFSSVAGTIATPVGWTLHKTVTNAESKLYIFSRVFQTGDTTVTFTPSGGSAGDGIVGVTITFENAGAPQDFGPDGSFNLTHEDIPVPHCETALTSGTVIAIGCRNAGYSNINTIDDWEEDADISEGDVGVLLGIQHLNFTTAINLPDQQLDVANGTGTSVSSMFVLPATSTDFQTLTLNPPVPIADAPSIGDLVSFGVYGKETLRVLVRDIVPRSDLSAEITFVSEGAGVHVAELGPIPPWEANVTLPFPPPNVLSITSDASVMQVTASRVLTPRVMFIVTPSTVEGVTYYVSYRVTGTDGQWIDATISEYSSSSVTISGPESGITYDFRIIRKHPDYLSSQTVSVNSYRVVGKSDPPSPLQNLTIASVGGQANLQWDLSDDIDVQYGGFIIFRHSPVMEGATWANSTTIGRSVSGDQTHVYLPLIAGTYMAKVYDVDMLESSVVAVTTKQASLLTFVTEDEIVENPTFSGTKENCQVTDSKLELVVNDFDSAPDIDSEEEWDSIGSYVHDSGVYHFNTGFDFTTIKKVRLTTKLLMEAFNTNDLIDGSDLWDNTDDTDGILGAPVDAEIYGKITDDDPDDVGAVWSDFLRINSIEVECRGVGKIECRMKTNNKVYNILISELSIKAERL